MSHSPPKLTDPPAPYTFARLADVAEEIELSKDQATALQIVQLQTAVADLREQNEILQAEIDRQRDTRNQAIATLALTQRWARTWKCAAKINRWVRRDLGQKLKEVEQ